MLFIWSPSILLSILISWATREVLPSLDHFVDFVASFHFEAMRYFGCFERTRFSSLGGICYHTVQPCVHGCTPVDSLMVKFSYLKKNIVQNSQPQ